MVYVQKYSRRRNHRFDRPELVVSMLGRNRRSANWSLGGLAIQCEANETDEFNPEDVVTGSLGQVERPQRFDFEGRVVRIDHHRHVVAVEFSDLSKDAIMMFIDEFRDMIGGAA